jgi:phosphoribosylaminoimidazole (AIR) synthetase
MGIGMVLIVRPQAAERGRKSLKGAKIIGYVENGVRGVEIV